MTTDECICGEINARCCPVHQDDKRPLSDKLTDLGFLLNAYEQVLKERDLALLAARPVVNERLIAMTRERDEWYEKFAKLEIKRASCCEQMEAERDGARAEVTRLKEIISYLPKVPTEPYEKELAKRCLAAEAEIARLKILEKEHQDDWKRIQDAERNVEERDALIARLVEVLEHYANHEAVIKEAYHSNDEGQITVVHTFINHVAKAALADYEKWKAGK